MTTIDIAKLFYEKRQEYAEAYGIDARTEAWEDLPENYRLLMISAAEAVMDAMTAEGSEENV